MYWGDAILDTIEAAYLNGTGRKILLAEMKRALYFAFSLHDGDIYFTDWLSYRYAYVYGLFLSEPKLMGECYYVFGYFLINKNR